MRVLVTGAAGSIGTVVSAGLRAQGHEVAGLDLTARPDDLPGSWFTADCTDPDAVDAAFDDLLRSGPLDAVVHLASVPDEASLPVILQSHVTTTAVLLDAMVAHDVRRLVYASSNHAVGRTPRGELPTGLLTTEVRPRPDTFYGVGKVAAEALLSLYADRHDLDVVALRIGSFLPRPHTRRHLSTWLSHDDAVRMVHACLTAPAPGYAVVYGISANTRGWWDLEPGRRLGYDPQDDAEVFAAEVESAAPTEDDAVDAAHVGGPFTTAAYHRPALDRNPTGEQPPLLRQVVLDTPDTRTLAEFYRQLLGYEYRPGDEQPDADGDDWLVLREPGGARRVAFQKVPSLAEVTWPEGPQPQQLHLDLTVSTVEQLDAQHHRALGLGARLLLDRSEDPEEPLRVYADPAGHPFCIFVA